MATMYNPYQSLNYPNYRPANITPVNNGFAPGITWVNGEDAARSYPIPYNSTMLLMDQENPVLYVKTVDNIGRIVDFEVYDLINRSPKKEEANFNAEDFVKKTDLQEMLDSINKRFDDLTPKRPQPNRREER